MKKHIRILFIGNSHTYMNDLPAFVKIMAEEDGYTCDVTMLAHGGWYLAQHVRDKEARFNIKYGSYDYVVLQEHAHPFDHIADLCKAAAQLVKWAEDAGSKTVLFEPWARKDDEGAQEQMHKVHSELAEEHGIILAAVGKDWWNYKKAWPDIELYDEDGAHASKAGSEFAAKVIWTSIEADIISQSL